LPLFRELSALPGEFNYMIFSSEEIENFVEMSKQANRVVHGEHMDFFLHMAVS